MGLATSTVKVMAEPWKLSSQAVRQIEDAFPTMLQPKNLATTWAGEYKNGGMISSPEKIFSHITVSNGQVNGKANIDGVITAASNNKEVGEFTRIVNLDRYDGKLSVKHDYLALDKEAQGTGFAKWFNERAGVRYAQGGVDSIGIFAALDVGGYAWARQGFDLVGSPATRAKAIKSLVDSSPKLTSEDKAILKPWLIDSSGEVKSDTLTSVQALANIPGIGKRALLGNGWQGAKEVQRTDTWWAKYVPTAKDDAFEGVSYLKTPELVKERMAEAAKSIDKQMPSPFNSDAIKGAFMTQMGKRASYEDGSLDAIMSTGKDKLRSLTKDFTIQTDEKKHSLKISLSPDKTRANGSIPETADDSLKQNIRSVYDQLGVSYS